MKMRNTFSMACIAVVAFAAAAAWAAPVEWPASTGGNGHYYELVQDPMTWVAARDAAALRTWMDLPGHLVTLTSHDEDQWCWQQFGYLDHGFLIGAFQQPGSAEPAGGWSWVTGEPWSYTGWGGAEPNNTGGNENCSVAWFSNFTGWNDGVCDGVSPWGYIVEYEAAPVPAEMHTWGAIKSEYR